MRWIARVFILCSVAGMVDSPWPPTVDPVNSVVVLDIVGPWSGG
jgi:hypothetical protein